MKLNHIYQGDCLEVLRTFPNESIDLVITSPPYKEEDGYSQSLMKGVVSEVYRVLKPNSLFYLNFGHLAADKARPWWLQSTALDQGFNYVDTITWVKKQFSPIQGDKRLNNLTEFIFQFSKGTDYHLDRLSIGVPYEDKSNIGRYSDQDLRCGGNVWYIGYKTITRSSQKLHKDRFPLELPQRCIKLSNLPDGAVVLDPFMGSGTTAVAALSLGKQYIGIELEKEYVDLANQRIEAWTEVSEE